MLTLWAVFSRWRCSFSELGEDSLVMLSIAPIVERYDWIVPGEADSKQREREIDEYVDGTDFSQCYLI